MRVTISTTWRWWSMRATRPTKLVSSSGSMSTAASGVRLIGSPAGIWNSTLPTSGDLRSASVNSRPQDGHRSWLSGRQSARQRPAAPVLACAVEPGALRLRPLLLRALEAVDELQGGVELLRPSRVLRRDPPVEQAEGVADDAVRLGDDRLAGGDGQELRALRLAARRTDGDDPKAEMFAGAVRSRLGDALQDEVGQIEAQLRSDPRRRMRRRRGRLHRCARQRQCADRHRAASHSPMLPGRPWHRCRRARSGADDRARGLGLSADCQPRMRRWPCPPAQLNGLRDGFGRCFLHAGRRSNRRQPRGCPRPPVCK